MITEREMIIQAILKRHLLEGVEELTREIELALEEYDNMEDRDGLGFVV